MFGTSSSLLLKLQGVHGEWREEEDDYDNDQYESESEDQPVFLPKRQLAMSDDLLFAPPKPEREQALIALLAAKQAETSGCSICLDVECDDDMHRLGCGHSFCRDCIAEYLRQKIRAREINRRRKTWLAPLPSEKICAARLHVELIYGITCPHLGCEELIDVPEIQKLVDSTTFEIYDNHALSQTLDSMAALRKCPQKCGGWIQQDCICTSKECIEKVMRKKDLVQGHIFLGRWAQSVGAKCCPKCFVPIEKNMGCDHMYCVTCRNPFLWSQAPMFGTAGHWYRPEVLPAETADLPAGFRRIVVQI